MHGRKFTLIGIAGAAIVAAVQSGARAQESAFPVDMSSASFGWVATRRVDPLPGAPPMVRQDPKRASH